LKNITKLAILVGLALQFGGHPVDARIIGWDYCIERGHPLTFYGYRYGWPIPVVEVGQTWGCLSIPSTDIMVHTHGLLFSSLFWATVIWVLESYWPTGVGKNG